MTKEEMLRQEDRSIMNAMDAAAAKRNESTNIMEQFIIISNQNSLLRQENIKLFTNYNALKTALQNIIEYSAGGPDKSEIKNEFIYAAEEAIKKAEQ